MTDNSKAVVVAGMAAGYLLGRTKKAKLAIAVASFALGRRGRFSAKELVADGLRKLEGSSHVSQLSEQVRDQLLTAGRSAMHATVNRGADSFADALADRTKLLTGGKQDSDDSESDSAQSAGSSEQDERSEAEEEKPEEKKPEEKKPEEEKPAEKKAGKNGGKAPAADDRDEEPQEDEPQEERPAKSSSRRKPGEPLAPRPPRAKHAVRRVPSAQSRHAGGRR